MVCTFMYRRGKYNLNTMSHDTAIGLVKGALAAGVQVLLLLLPLYVLLL